MNATKDDDRWTVGDFVRVGLVILLIVAAFATIIHQNQKMGEMPYRISVGTDGYSCHGYEWQGDALHLYGCAGGFPLIHYYDKTIDNAANVSIEYYGE